MSEEAAKSLLEVLLKLVGEGAVVELHDVTLRAEKVVLSRVEEGGGKGGGGG